MTNGAAARIPFQKNKREVALLLFVLFMRTYDNPMLGLQISCSSLVIPINKACVSTTAPRCNGFGESLRN